MTAMVTLHHFSDPVWFANLGGFEKEENIKHFINFTQKVAGRLKDKVKIWCTINEPNIYAFMGYCLGLFPQQKHNPFLVLKVLKNLLTAHTQTYTALKIISPELQVGIVHQFLKFESYHKWNLADVALCKFFTYLIHDAAFNFLKTNSPKSYDFIGLNYYSKVIINFFTPSYNIGQIMTDYQYAIYPEGIYEAIKEVSSLNVPIYITENGIADWADDRREFFIKSYTNYVKKAINEGFEVKGYFYWTLTDNFEWHEGYSKYFGAYSVDFESQKRTLKPGAACLKNIFNNMQLSYNNAKTVNMDNNR